MGDIIKQIQTGPEDIYNIHAYQSDEALKINANAGSANKPVYFSNGIPVECNFTVETSVPQNAKFTDENTKNTAGATDSSSKLFLIGATDQSANPVTYSHNTAYVGTDGCLYSNDTKVSVSGHTHAYLPLAGGTLTGDLTISSGNSNAAMPALQWGTVSSNSPYTGFAKDQSDGTFIICSMEKGVESAKHYKNGLSIGGGSGNLFWKGNQIVTIQDKLANPYSLTIQGNGTTLTHGTYDGSGSKTVNITPSSIGAAPQIHEHNAGDITTGELSSDRLPVIPIHKGGTNASSVEKARENLSVYSIGQVDTLINSIVGEGAAETLDTIGKISEALKGDKDIIDALTPSKSFEDHEKADNPHNITKVTIGLSKVENKSSEDIRKELEKADVTAALGYTPPSVDTNTTYTFATGDNNGQIKITPSVGNPVNVDIKGLGTAAYKNIGDFATTGRNEFTGNQILANHTYLYGTYASGDYGNLIGLSNNDNIIIGGSAHPDTNIYFYGKLNLNHALSVEEGGTGATAAAGAISNISSSAIQLGSNGISTLTVNGIDYAMTSTEYDELIALT